MTDKSKDEKPWRKSLAGPAAGAMVIAKTQDLGHGELDGSEMDTAA